MKVFKNDKSEVPAELSEISVVAIRFASVEGGRWCLNNITLF